MQLITHEKLTNIVPHFRDAVGLAACASFALGFAEFSFLGTVHVANLVFGAVASIAALGFAALAGANVALIVGEVRG